MPVTMGEDPSCNEILVKRLMALAQRYERIDQKILTLHKNISNEDWLVLSHIDNLTECMEKHMVLPEEMYNSIHHDLKIMESKIRYLDDMVSRLLVY